MGDTKFICNARFVGRTSVDGPLNDYRLSDVVSSLQEEAKLKKSSGDEIRCNLEFSERNLLVTFIKKDEGFESDTESAKSLEPGGGEGVEEKSVPGTDEKIIKDHVYRFNEPGEDSYSSNSSGGSDSETSDHNKTNSASTSASASPTAELQKYKFDHLDTYSISDVLICHTDKQYKSCVIWVIRKSGSLEALVFECVTEEYARQLYRNFHEVSKRSKLERHRRRKSDGGSIITRTDLSGLKGTDRANNAPSIKGEAAVSADKAAAGDKNNQKWNLVQHTDKNGVTHIEVETSQPNHLVRQREAEPRSLLSFSPAKFSSRGIARNSGNKTEKSKFAKELESILSNEIKRRDDQVSSDKNEAEVLTSTGRSRPTGESLSLRQRAPAMLLRKLDEFEEKAHKIWAKAEADEENRKVWSKSSNSVIGISSPPRGPQIDLPQEKVKYKKPPGKDGLERREENRNVPLPSQPDSLNTNASKTKQKETSVTKKDDGNRILIPTKTGKEPPKKLYPKESPPIFSGRFLPIGMSNQPHSLPIYPLPVGWNRIPADMSQLDVWKYAQEQQWRQQPGAQERSRSRDRGRMDPDMRRRAQSKSPARRPTSRYIDSHPNEDSRFGRIFRDFGDAVRNRMARKGEVRVSGGTDQPEIALKSNLKKQKNIAPDIREVPHNRHNSGREDNKKVHFNKFATVQMMG